MNIFRPRTWGCLRTPVVDRLKAVFLGRRNVGPFKLRDASIGGKGLHADAAGDSWTELRARSYGTVGPRTATTDLSEQLP
jgi:hypothetical protein